MIEKFKGGLGLPSGKVIDCDIEIDVEPLPLDPEFIEQTRNLREVIEKVKQTVFYVALGDDGIHRPTGPIVDSTLAEESEEGQ